MTLRIPTNLKRSTAGLLVTSAFFAMPALSEPPASSSTTDPTSASVRDCERYSGEELTECERRISEAAAERDSTTQRTRVSQRDDISRESYRQPYQSNSPEVAPAVGPAITSATPAGRAQRSSLGIDDPPRRGHKAGERENLIKDSGDRMEDSGDSDDEE